VTSFTFDAGMKSLLPLMSSRVFPEFRETAFTPLFTDDSAGERSMLSIFFFPWSPPKMPAIAACCRQKDNTRMMRIFLRVFIAAQL
jgi:hypothetical protein